jgi:hypothetical protein
MIVREAVPGWKQDLDWVFTLNLTKNPPMPQKNISLEILTSSPHLDTPNIRIGGRSAAMRVIPESPWEVH